MATVLDAYAMLAFLEKERSFEYVQQALEKAAESKDDLYMTVVNWAEVYYIVEKERGLSTAEETAKLMETFPINIIDVDLPLARESAHLKARYKLSFADCFAAGLAKLYKAPLLTGDKEFRQVEKEIKIIWM